MKHLSSCFLSTSVQKILRGAFLENPVNINSNIPSKPYWAKIWCILLKQQSQGPWISFTSSTELKSSFPFGFIRFSKCPIKCLICNWALNKIEPLQKLKWSFWLWIVILLGVQNNKYKSFSYIKYNYFFCLKNSLQCLFKYQFIMSTFSEQNSGSLEFKKCSHCSFIKKIHIEQIQQQGRLKKPHHFWIRPNCPL